MCASPGYDIAKRADLVGKQTGLQIEHMARKRTPAKFQLWIDARKRHHLSHAHVQMARELGMNPKNLGKIDNHNQEPWKTPLPQFIEQLYEKRFGKTRPESVLSMEERARLEAQKKAARREEKARRRPEKS
jgi:hypothetical protein